MPGYIHVLATHLISDNQAREPLQPDQAQMDMQRSQLQRFLHETTEHALALFKDKNPRWDQEQPKQIAQAPPAKARVVVPVKVEVKVEAKTEER
jgi:hypothetical protein